MTAARDQLHPTDSKTRNRFVLNRARGFESHHLRQQKASAQAGAFFAARKYVSIIFAQNLLKRVRKPDILLLRPLWAPLGVLSGTEELFVFVPPQHEGIHVVSSVLQAVLVQHSGTPGKAHTRQSIVLCHDKITRLYPVDQRKVHTVSTLRDFLHFCMGESTQNRLTSAGRNPYNGNRKCDM